MNTELLTPDAIENNHERADAQINEYKGNMIGAINSILDKKDWRQEDIAKVLDISQPRVSNLRKCKEDMFSVQTLQKFLIILGYDFTFGFQEASGRGAHKLKVNVTLAR